MVSFDKRKWKNISIWIWVGWKTKKYPTSIILLSNGITNGFCYDRALLMSRAFLNDDDYDVNLLYATIVGLRLNPSYKRDDDLLTYDHCIVEIKEKEF